MCPDTFTSSYSSHVTLVAGEVAAMAEERKCKKCSADTSNS